MEQRDYYETLEIDREASQQKIKEAYRKLAFQYHPDRNEGDSAAADRMKTINEAYAVLSDPQKRRNYDGFRQTYGDSAYSRFRQGYTEEDIFRGSDINQIFEEMAKSFGFRGFDEVFKASYGSNYRTFQFQSGGMSGRGFIFSGPFGRQAPKQELPKAGIVSGLLGKLFGYALKKMTGMELPQPGRDRHDRLVLDAGLMAKGGKVRYKDPEQSREVSITIPAGIADGQTIRLRGMGQPGSGGSTPGDLYLKVQMRWPLLQKVRDLLKA